MALTVDLYARRDNDGSITNVIHSDGPACVEARISGAEPGQLFDAEFVFTEENRYRRTGERAAEDGTLLIAVPCLLPKGDYTIRLALNGQGYVRTSMRVV